MKRINLLFTAALALLVFSCSKDNENTIETLESGVPTEVMISLASDNVRGTGSSPSFAVESQIGQGIIMIFNGSSSTAILDGSATFNFNNGPITAVKVPCTAGPNRSIYVVANVNPTVFSNVNTIADLYNITTKPTITSYQSGSNLPMSGFVTGINTSTSTPSSPLAQSVSISFMCSKVEIAWDTTNITGGMIGAGFQITDAYILNAKSATDCFAASGGYLTDNVTSFLYGRSVITGFTGNYTYLPATTNTYSASMGLGGSVTGNNNFNNFFYVTENASANPTIVVIEAKAGATKYFYPIIINGPQNGNNGNNTGDGSSMIVRGNVYHVKAYIEAWGNSNPYDPINPGAVNVTIQTTNWNPTINIDQVFQ